MSAAEPTVVKKIAWWERAADHLNSILVKETRQALKSRQFFLTFILLLLAAWAVSVLGTAMNPSDVEYGAAGRKFFIGFYIVLALATVVVVPFGAYRSLLAERDLNTYDLLSITTLSPGKIVRGKLWSAVLQLFIFYSAITPFMAFASLLNGFDAPTAAFVLTASLFVSVLLSTAALMFATFAKQRIWQGFSSLGVLGMLGWVFMGASMLVTEIVDRNVLQFDDPDLWWGVAACAVGGLSYFALFQQITVAQMTFESGNRSTGIRLAATGQYVLFWAVVGFLFAWNWSRFGSVPDEAPMTFAVLSGLHWAVFGLFAVTEPEALSRRVHRDLPRRRWLRALLLPFLPGGGRGMIWVTGAMFSLWWFVLVFWGFLQGDPRTSYSTTSSVTGMTPAGTPTAVTLPTDFWSRGGMTLSEEIGRTLGEFPDTWSPPMQLVTTICLYLVIVLGLASAAGRFLRRLSGEITPAHIRVLTVIAVTFTSMTPMLMRATRLINPTNNYRLIDMLNPIDTMIQVGDRRNTGGEPVLGILIFLALAVLGLNLRAMATGVREAVFGTGAAPGRETVPSATTRTV